MQITHWLEPWTPCTRCLNATRAIFITWKQSYNFIQPLQDVSSSSKFEEKASPNFENPKISRDISASIKTLIIATPGGWWFTESFNCRIYWVASKNPFRNGATHTHHTRQTLAQGRLEERHDKAGRTPDYAEPSMCCRYDPLVVYPGVPLRDAEQTFGTFSHMSPVSLVAFTTSSGLRE